MAKPYVQPQNKSYELKGSYRETLITALKDVQSAANRVYFPQDCKIETVAGPTRTKSYKIENASSKEVLQKVLSDLSDYRIAADTGIYYGKKGRQTLELSGPAPGNTFGKQEYTSAENASKMIGEIDGDIDSMCSIFLESTKESNKRASIRKKHSGFVVEFVEKPLEREFEMPRPFPGEPFGDTWETTPLSDALKYLEGLDKEIGVVRSVERARKYVGLEYQRTNKIYLRASTGGQKYDVTVGLKDHIFGGGPKKRLFGKDRIDVTWAKAEK